MFSLQGMENKGDALVIRLEVKARVDRGGFEIDRGAIEKDIKQLYQAKFQALETQYEERFRLQNKHLDDIRATVEDVRQLRDRDRQENTKLLRLIETLAAKQGDTYVTFERNVGSAFNQGKQTNITGEVAGEQNQVAQTQGNQSPSPLSQADVVELLAQIKRLIDAAEISPEVKVEARAHLKTAQKATEQAEPEKKVALATLESMAETLKEASKTVEAGKTLWGQVSPILVKVAEWLGAAAGSLLMRL